MVTRQKQIRLEAGMSQTAAAADAGVCPVTWRLFEAEPKSVSEPKRAACEAAIERMVIKIANKKAA